MRTTRVAEVRGKRLTLSNLEKDLYPSAGFTKAQVLDYYRRISRFILPHLAGRALTLKRYPDGVDAEYFYEKRCPVYRPSWVSTAKVRQHDGTAYRACVIDSLNALIWVENLASLELHVPLARADSAGTPDSVVFDLDPGESAGILQCAVVAFILRDMLAELRLAGYVKTSGKKGLHVLVPLNTGKVTFDQTKAFSKAVAEAIQRKYPDLVTAKMPKPYRKGKVFINWSQNDPSKTMVCVYSLRARERPIVSAPLAWQELQRLAKRADPEKLQFTYAEALARAEKRGDIFKDVLTKRQKLPRR